MYLIDTYAALTAASAIAANGLLRYVLGSTFPLFTIQSKISPHHNLVYSIKAILTSQCTNILESVGLRVFLAFWDWLCCLFRGYYINGVDRSEPQVILKRKIYPSESRLTYDKICDNGG